MTKKFLANSSDKCVSFIVCVTNRFGPRNRKNYPETIDRELGWAEGLGFNTLRVFSHDVVWEADPKGFKERVATFLDICGKHNMRVFFTFFTNGGPG